MSMPPVHPAAELFPMMSDDELRALADDIRANGLQQPVVLYGAQLLDGRNRWRACEMAGVEVKTKDWAGKDAVAYVRSLNLHRRHLTAAQRAALAVKAEPVYAEAAADKQKSDGKTKGGNPRVGNQPKGKRDEKSRALAQAAKETGASLDSAKAMKQVATTDQAIVELVQRGQVETVADAKRVAALPDTERAEVIDRVRAGASVAEAFTVAGAIQKVREQRGTPIGQVIAAVESVRKHAAAVRGACDRLDDVCSKFQVTDMRSPDFLSAGMSLLQARSDISRAIKTLRVKDEADAE